MQPLQCAAGVVEPALDAAAGLGRWCDLRGLRFVLPMAGVLLVEAQLAESHSAG